MLFYTLGIMAFVYHMQFMQKLKSCYQNEKHFIEYANADAKHWQGFMCTILQLYIELSDSSLQ